MVAMITSVHDRFVTRNPSKPRPAPSKREREKRPAVACDRRDNRFAVPRFVERTNAPSECWFG